MSKVTGLLSKCYKNDKGMFSISVEDVWYGCYKTDYTHLEGQTVTFEATQKGKYFNAKDPVTAVAGQAPASVAGGTAAAMPADARQKSIVMQSSYKTAAEVLGALIGGDHLTLGAKAKAFDNALGFLDQIAVHIYKNGMNPDNILVDEDDPAPPKGEYVAHEA